MADGRRSVDEGEEATRRRGLEGTQGSIMVPGPGPPPTARPPRAARRRRGPRAPGAHSVEWCGGPEGPPGWLSERPKEPVLKTGAR